MQMSAASTPATAATPIPTPTSAIATRSGQGALLAALADALAGALGSVVAVAVFYPIDIAKTRAQASSSPAISRHDGHDDERGGNVSGTSAISTASEVGKVTRTARTGGGQRTWFRSRTLTALLSIVKTEGGLTRLYAGIEAKVLQALLGSFVYFYAYTWIKGVMRRRAVAGGSIGIGGDVSKSLRPSLNLLAAAMAGAVNQAFTLPLENITTRMQTAPQHAPPPSPSPADSGDGKGVGDAGGDDGGGGGVGALGRSAFAGGRGGGGSSDASGTWRDQAPTTAVETLQKRGDNQTRMRGRRRPRQSVAAVTGDLYREGRGVGRFWRGFTPSLILTCNPAINYTAFDILKVLWLRRRDASIAAASAGGVGSSTARAVAAGNATRGAGGFLNPLEAFLVAAAAKSLATLITYPLIRAKVVLMAAPSSPLSPIVGDSERRPPVALSSASAPPAAVALETRSGREGDLSRSCDLSRSSRENRTTTGTSTSTSTGSVGTGAEGWINERDQRSSAKGETGAAATYVSERHEPAQMAASPSTTAAGSAAATAATAAAVEEKKSGEGTGRDVRGMGSVMLDIFRREGLGGLYAGCGAQLLHTILKSALLLATKEQIARAAASAVFLGGSRGGAVGFAKPPAASR